MTADIENKFEEWLANNDQEERKQTVTDDQIKNYIIYRM